MGIITNHFQNNMTSPSMVVYVEDGGRNKRASRAVSEEPLSTDSEIVELHRQWYDRKAHFAILHIIIFPMGAPL